MCAIVKFHERESAKDLLKRKRKNMLVTVFVIAAYVVPCVKNMLDIVKIENVKKLVSVFHIFENDRFD